MNKEYILVVFILGMIFNMIQDLIMSLINYLNDKAWLVRDYEEIIYNYLNCYDVVDFEEKEIICIAVNNYNKRKAKGYKLNKFLDKFRRKKIEK